jgi:ribulose-phosphate 3-epimerase
MTVNPGFGSQSLLSSVVPKIRDLREIVRKRKLSLEIQVDGGINRDTSAKVIEAGASILVAGTAVFNASDPEKAILRLKNSQKGELGGNKNSTAKNGS